MPLLHKPRIVTLTPATVESPFHHRGKHVPWLEVWQHVATRVGWAEPGVDMQVFSSDNLLEEGKSGSEGQEDFIASLSSADIFIASTVKDPIVSQWAAKEVSKSGVKTRYCRDSVGELGEASLLGEYRPQPGDSTVPRWIENLPDFLQNILFGATKKDRELWSTLGGFYDRNSSEDLVFLVLVLVDTFTALEVGRVTGIGKDGGLDTLKCMLTNCKKEVLNCAKDPACRACIDCLQKCPPNDQVCAYRCITSYETKAMEAFSLCVLQKNNCMCNSAEIPSLPNPSPLAQFRGKPLTFTAAEDLFIGWLGKLPYSWKVVCGQNPAYDFFPSQHQIFYRGRGKGQMWYDPVFKVFTLDGKEAWRRRHYRVRAADTPGTFHFSVLDNGVTSKEYWRIMDVAEDLSWGVFYYAGAASAAGQSYTGGLLVTPEGSWPAESEMGRVEEAFEACGMKMWELFEVDNSDTNGAPLGLSDDFAAHNNNALGLV
ncbi:unnamed protein product [Choristocarpus tenellus]